jgi:hypothetical protein
MKRMTKRDYKRILKDLYNPSKRIISVVNVPTMNYITIKRDTYDGFEDFYNNEDAHQASETLERLAHSVKFVIKSEDENKNYTAMPLEALFKNIHSKQPYKLCIMQPEELNEEILKTSKEKAIKKKGIDLQILRVAEIESITEGLSIQITHIGSYDNIELTKERLIDYMELNGLQPKEYYHEIYIGDPRRSKLENLKTILRQPVRLIE